MEATQSLVRREVAKESHWQPTSSRLRMKIDQTYSYLAKQVDPIIAPCVATFVFYQPIDVISALRTYFSNHQIKMPFEGLVCYDPKKSQKNYFAVSLEPILSKVVDAIAAAQPSEVVLFICGELDKNVAHFDDICGENLMTTSSPRNKLSDTIELANTVA